MKLNRKSATETNQKTDNPIQDYGQNQSAKTGLHRQPTIKYSNTGLYGKCILVTKKTVVNLNQLS